MKHLPTLTQTVLAAMLLWFLASAGLPWRKAEAASPTPTSLPPAADPGSCEASRSVAVTGSALINVIPDRALVQLGVQSNGAEPQSTATANSVATQRVIKALLAEGVEAKDIATDIYLIEPVYEDYDSLYIKGYRINNVVEITLRDVRKTSDILAASLAAGANQVIKVEFYTSELRKYRDQARDLAVKAAREKADALAGAAGAEAGCVLAINENSWSYYNGWWSGGNQNVWTQNAVQNAAPGANPIGNSTDEPVSLGQISVKAEVSATFSLR
jgi:uncharacterized protein